MGKHTIDLTDTQEAAFTATGIDFASSVDRMLRERSVAALRSGLSGVIDKLQQADADLLEAAATSLATAKTDIEAAIEAKNAPKVLPDEGGVAVPVEPLNEEPIP